MPRIPDQDSLGARPIPTARRSISTVRNAGGVAEAAGQFGATISDMAGRTIEKQDIGARIDKGRVEGDGSSRQTDLTGLVEVQ